MVVGGRKMIEFSVQDTSVHRFSSIELKALYNRPVTFRREAVGGMGTGMCCLAARVKALGGDCGARLRADSSPGTVVWFRVPWVEGLVAVPQTSGLSAMDLSAMDPAVSARPLVSDPIVFLAKKFDSVSKLIRRGSSLQALGNGGNGGSGTGECFRQSRRVERVERVEEEGDITGERVAMVQSQRKGQDKGQDQDQGKAEDQYKAREVQAPAPATLVLTLAPVPATGLALEAGRRPASGQASVPAPGKASGAVSRTPRTDKPLNGLTSLVVADAPTIGKMVTRRLAAAGATVESAKDGREGVEVFKAAEVAFDIVVTDIKVHLLHTHITHPIHPL